MLREVSDFFTPTNSQRIEISHCLQVLLTSIFFNSKTKQDMQKTAYETLLKMWKKIIFPIQYGTVWLGFTENQNIPGKKVIVALSKSP